MLQAYPNGTTTGKLMPCSTDAPASTWLISARLQEKNTTHTQTTKETLSTCNQVLHLIGWHYLYGPSQASRCQMSHRCQTPLLLASICFQSVLSARWNTSPIVFYPRKVPKGVSRPLRWTSLSPVTRSFADQCPCLGLMEFYTCTCCHCHRGGTLTPTPHNPKTLLTCPPPGLGPHWHDFITWWGPLDLYADKAYLFCRWVRDDEDEHAAHEILLQDLVLWSLLLLGQLGIPWGTWCNSASCRWTTTQILNRASIPRPTHEEI